MSMATGKTKLSIEALRKSVSLGREPDFGDAPSNAQLMEMVLALAAEVSVLRDRLDTHERLAANGDLPAPDKVEAFEIAPDVFAARSTLRQRLLHKLFRPIRQAAARDILARHDAQSGMHQHAAQ